MITITIENGQKLSRTKFKTWEDFQMELVLLQENSELSPEHKRILKEREAIADTMPKDRLSWEEVKRGIKRNNV